MWKSTAPLPPTFSFAVLMIVELFSIVVQLNMLGTSSLNILRKDLTDNAFLINIYRCTLMLVMCNFADVQFCCCVVFAVIGLVLLDC